MKHATAIRDGFIVPMIGIPETSVLQECDCCHDLFDLQQVRWTGVQMLCAKCDDPTHHSVESTEMVIGNGA